MIVVLACVSPASAATLPGGFSEVTIKGGLTNPTAAAWAPDGRLFVTEKGGRLRVVKTDGSVATVVDLSSHVNSYSDRGMLGVAVDKDFATNHYVYLVYSSGASRARSPTPPGAS